MARKTSPLVGVYANSKHCMNDSIFPALHHFDIPFMTIDKEYLAGLEPGDFDVLLLPGGWYFFEDKINDRIKRFVADGGGFVGICCGAINACKIGLLNAEMYSMFGVGPTVLEPVDGDHYILKDVIQKSKAAHRKWERINILRYNGWPMLLKDGANMIAAYDMDLKLAAIAWAEYEKGRVVAFSPHPEGARCEPGIFKDRDNHPMVYDGVAMGTATMLDNAIKFVASDDIKSDKIKTV